MSNQNVCVMKKLKKLVVIMPCYNEDEILEHTVKTMQKLMCRLIEENKICASSKVCFVNDGSTDNSWTVISDAVKQDSLFTALNLSRNFGHQSAILAGMYDVEADVYVTIDTDLQDDPECIEEMLQKIENGCDVVYGVRKSRDCDTWFKKVSAQLYYRMLKLLGVNIIYNHADFRMMTRRAVETLKRFPEKNLFLRAIVPLLGFDSACVYYDRIPRLAGKTKYPLQKMIALAWNGISNFSIVPLRLVTFTGFFLCFLSMIFLVLVIYRWSVRGTIVGWASTVAIITVFSGVQLVSLGIIGEYLAKVFVEVKRRPLFIVKEKISMDEFEG